jgi:hypothetical protein
MVYRDLDDVVELTKVAAALEVAEKGRMHCYKGRKFSDLQLDPVEIEPDHSGDEAEDIFDQEDQVEDHEEDHDEDQEEDSGDDEKPEPPKK